MIRLNVMGVVDLRGAGQAELRTVISQPKRLALLTYLTLASPRGYRRRDTLLALFWPELDNAHARSALRQALHHLRQALGESVVLNRGAEEVGIDANRLWCDATAFEDALAAGDPITALEQYRGDLLPGFFASGAPEFERWLDAERAHLREQAAAAAWTLAEQAAACGDAATASQRARWAAALTPDDEDALRRLLRLLVHVGDRGAATRAYDAFAKRLAEDIGAEPATETRAVLELPTSVSVAALSASPPTLPPSSQVPVPSHRRLPWKASAAMLLVASLVVVTWPTGGRAPASNGAALAVFPFSVEGRPELAYLREGMVDLLSAKLEGVPELRSIDPRAVIAASPARALSPRAARPIAQRLGARLFAVGDVVEIAGRVTLTAALYATSDATRPIEKRSVEGEMARLPELVDELAGQLLATQTNSRDTALTRLAAVTTQSLPALKAYLAGEQALRADRDAQAVARFQEAIALDSGFALAYYRLAIASTWAAQPDVDPSAVATAAARRSGRLTPLARTLLSAYQAYQQGRPDEAERLYRQITMSHADNVEAWLMLGETWFHWNPPRGRAGSDADSAFERALALDPQNPHALIHLARAAAFTGRRERLDSLAHRFYALDAPTERNLEMRALVAFTEYDSTETAAVIAASRSQGDALLNALLNAALVYGHRWDLVADLGRSATDDRNPRFLLVWRRVFTDLVLAQGHRDVRPFATGADADWLLETRALVAAEAFWGFDRSEIVQMRSRLLGRENSAFRSYLLGLLSMRIGDTADARMRVGKLQRLAVPEASDLAAALDAELSSAGGDVERALQDLHRINVVGHLATIPHFGLHERFLRAELLHTLGRESEALEVYGSFWSVYDLVYAAPAELRQAEIYDRRGDVERAALHYARFASMWQACDPALRPLVDRALGALERLGRRPLPVT